jgi:hypothetical protein
MLNNIMKSIKPSRTHFLPGMMFLAVVTAATNPITVVSYYFGNYHSGDPRNTKTKGANWSEWKLVKNAKPRFPRTPSAA